MLSNLFSLFFDTHTQKKTQKKNFVNCIVKQTDSTGASTQVVEQRQIVRNQPLSREKQKFKAKHSKPLVVSPPGLYFFLT